MKTKLADAEERNRQAQKAKERLRDEIDLKYGIKTRKVKNMLRKLNKEMSLLTLKVRTILRPLFPAPARYCTHTS